MNEALSAAQRRAVVESDPVTGQIKAPASTLGALRRLGLAVAYGRVGASYLTEAGRQVREDLRRESAPAPPQVPQLASAAHTFVADTGDEVPTDTVPERDAELLRLRAEEVARAWAGLLEVRRVSGAGTQVPAAWERSRPAQAVALALESAGLAPSGRDSAGRVTRPGYRVRPADEPGIVRVEWRTPTRTERAEPHLAECVAELGRHGWHALEYRDRARPFLLVAPSPAP